ncbi:MAG: hypothetical protein EOO87_12670 [Pedobacter sp.]|nr:MAG: hypothetical protein EOO87_12670 [Pedobacter sp.]
MANRTNFLKLYLFVSGLIILNVCLYNFARMSFVGYWSDRVIFWLWLLTTPVVVFLFWKKILTKIYFWLLVIGLILTILPMAIPFFAILLSGSGSGRLNHFNLENDIRIQTVGYGVMGRPRLQIVKNGLLFDKIKLEDGDEITINDTTWVKVKDVNTAKKIIKSADLKTFEIRDAKNAKLINETDTSITVKYFFEKDTVETTHVFKEKTSFNY